MKRKLETDNSSSKRTKVIKKQFSPRASIATVFTRQTLVENLKNRKYSNVSFLIGAGISVSAGIPDFRTPRTGLYAQVKTLGLPHPEDIFSLEYFQFDPKPFYSIAKDFLSYEVSPTSAHHFIRRFADEKILQMVYSQNIDGLEKAVGIPEKNLVQAHGNMERSRCCKCKKEEVAMSDFFKAVDKGEVLYCSRCDRPDAIIKPDIIFFGEKLSQKFHRRVEKLTAADLVFVIGTSLKVSPFSELVKTIGSSVLLVVINRDLPQSTSSSNTKKIGQEQGGKGQSHKGVSIDRPNLLFLQGEIDEIVSKLVEDIGWTSASACDSKAKTKTKARDKISAQDKKTLKKSASLSKRSDLVKSKTSE